MSNEQFNSGSELTDLDEEEEVPLSQQGKTRSKAHESGFKLRGTLRVPRATTYTCQSLYEQISAQDIDLQPEYQREVVWPDAKQIGLIDSIFRNFYVPPVIFVVHTSDDGGERRVCVDGKQRLTSIYRFIAGEIPYKDPFTSQRYYFKRDLADSKGQLLPERYKKVFMNKQIVCMEYQEITPENEREIFQRVQLGMALTPAERLQAISCPLTGFIRELLDTYIVENLATYIEWDTTRANDFRSLATAVYCMSKWPHLTSAPSISALEKWLHEADELDEEFEEDVKATFQIFCELAQDQKLKKCFWLPGVKKVAPVEVLAISLLIYIFKRKMSLPQLSEAIRLLRQDIRNAEKDIRLNSRTMKVVISFLRTLKPSQLQAEGGEPAASQQHTGKRKRPFKEPSEEGEEGESTPPATKSKSTKSTKSIKLSPSSTPAPPLPKPVPPPPTPSIIKPPPSSPALQPPTSFPTSSRLPAVPNGTTLPMHSPKLPPTAPAALRQNMSPPSTLSSYGLPSRPPTGPPPRQNSLGDILMARMASAPAPTGPRTGGALYQSPTAYQSDYQSNRPYESSRDPRLAHANGGRGSGQQTPDSSYGRRQ
ncbi:hypothetical protein C8Q70DRAFT_75347 [Cubamyces menziesii]|nr:hypothetical protein C8Q70DRAFT_75347 [Cubamyces menziesii]